MHLRPVLPPRRLPAGGGRGPEGPRVRHRGRDPRPATQGAQGQRVLRRVRQGWKEVSGCFVLEE